jgi:amino acid adenylation domain-containing protein
MISEEERSKLLFDFNNTKREIPRDQCYHRLFQQYAAENPGRVAAKHKEKTITYKELNEKSNRIAHYLIEQGLETDSMVALYLPRGIEMLAAIIGVFKAGGAYLPIELDYPIERIQYMIKDAEVRIIIKDRESQQKQLEDELMGDLMSSLRILYLEDNRQLEQCLVENPPNKSTPDNYAYMIYTSGTTGQPKGVIIHQQGMINHLYAKINDLSINEKDRLAQTASPCFDISVWQFLAPLLKGGATVIFDYEVVLNPEAMLKGLQRERITIFESVPSLMAVFLEMLETCENSQLNDLRWMIPTGEAVQPSLVRDWFKHYPKIKLLNAYGPTEASDDITHYMITSTADVGQSSVSIGKPIQNMRIYILDKNLSLCPIGVRGEICVAGLGVGKGYWKDPEKTKHVFIPNPYGRGFVNQDYAILYRTGDIGYFREDGNVECLGRIDNQVKIRGFRIELEEIEKIMLEHPSLKECAVLVKKSEKTADSIVAFLVEKEPIDIEKLKAFILRYLPSYMLPSAFVQLKQLPLGRTGKVDRKALALMDIDNQVLDTSADFTPPQTETEKKIADIWSDALEVSQISIHGNFFDLGGHSLLIPRIFNKIDKIFPGKSRILDLFEYMTIYELARQIDGIDIKADEEEDEEIIEISID